MKSTNKLLAGMLVLTSFLFAPAASHAATGCEAKRQSIEQQIDYAHSHNNNHRIAGLEKALSELNANCTVEGLRTEREADVRKKEQKVKERREELTEAQADGRTDKITKKQRKLEEAQAELNDAKIMLNK